MIFSSPAKINLSLKIIRKRSDGFHDIDSDFQFLNWGDKIEISSSNKLSVSTTKFQVSQQENLVTQALKKVQYGNQGKNGVFSDYTKRYYCDIYSTNCKFSKIFQSGIIQNP